MKAPIQRGTNISHWLSQCEGREGERRAWFTQDDVRRIADWGFDHIRLPIDEAEMWEENGRQQIEAFDLLDAALDWIDEAGLKAVVDLHILRSHFFGQAKEPALFTDPVEEGKFVEMWRQLSARLAGRSTEKVIYELMNEAVATDPEDWNRVALAAHRAVRETEPWRWIILGSNRWNSVSTFHQLRVPEDARTILTFHFYHPMLVTHHRAGWCPEGRMYDGPIRYPGQPVERKHLGSIAVPLTERERKLDWGRLNAPYGRQSMVDDIALPLSVAKGAGIPLYCGEFGVINRVPLPVREAWYRDIISVFSEYGIGWANWDYKGVFGLVTASGGSTGIAEIMMRQGKKAVAA